MQGFHHFCTALSFPGKVPYSVRLRCKSAGDLRVFSCQALSLVGPPKISSRRKQRRRCFRWPQACTKEKESQGDRGINPVLTLVLCRESPFTLFGFCASHNARRCSEAWRMILCYVLGVSHTPMLLYFLISSPYHLQRVAFPTVVNFLLDICRNFGVLTPGPPPAPGTKVHKGGSPLKGSRPYACRKTFLRSKNRTAPGGARGGKSRLE